MDFKRIAILVLLAVVLVVLLLPKLLPKNNVYPINVLKTSSAFNSISSLRGVLGLNSTISLSSMAELNISLNSSAYRPNALSSKEIVKYLLIPKSNTLPAAFTYIPIETTNSTQVNYICQFMPYAYQSPSYIGHNSNSSSIYSLAGQVELANSGFKIAKSLRAVPSWLTAYCVNNV